MLVRWPAARLAPLVAGLAGLAWFWFELAPQRTGFEDTDNPATGLQFIAAYPGAWVSAGIALAIAALALVATVIAIRDRLEAAASDDRGVAARAVSVVGLFAAFSLLGQAATRLAGEPLRYVAGMDQQWGEAAYLVTQFVGAQLFGVGGLTLLGVWSLGIGWLGARRGAVAGPVAVLSIVPGLRVAGIGALLGLVPDETWLLFMISIPGAFVWLVLLGAWPPSQRGADRLATSPASL